MGRKENRRAWTPQKVVVFFSPYNRTTQCYGLSLGKRKFALKSGTVFFKNVLKIIANEVNNFMRGEVTRHLEDGKSQVMKLRMMKLRIHTLLRPTIFTVPHEIFFRTTAH